MFRPQSVNNSSKDHRSLDGIIPTLTLSKFTGLSSLSLRGGR